ncbi:MAG: sugar phosphate nucleotidyltransferase [Oscillospiraceae bacterium]|nr:sugar phosphate nucleotidyltransferase [Oscillospiraceae bacterium]
MTKPTLVIMAAGMGSRFGGLKQIEPVGKHDELLMEYAVYDAIQAGFGKVLFVIKEEMLDDFKENVGARIAEHIDVDYCFQCNDNLPDGFAYPDGRQKPWGTGHAVVSCLGSISTPFCVINADDFYGRDAFMTVAKFLATMDKAQSPLQSCLIGYQAQNTMTEYGSVSRACCEMDADGNLISLTERTELQMRDGRLHDNITGEDLDADTPVSVTMFGLPPEILPLLWQEFEALLQAHKDDLSNVEFYLPTAIDALLKKGKLKMKVVPTESRWYGFTYREDREKVVAALSAMTESGAYLTPLWE